VQGTPQLQPLYLQDVRAKGIDFLKTIWFEVDFEIFYELNGNSQPGNNCFSVRTGMIIV
jgi:hypothetical protein